MAWQGKNIAPVLVTHSLFEFLLQLLFVILQIHYGLLCQLQVSFKLPLSSFQVHADFLFLFERAFELENEGRQAREGKDPW